MSNSDKKEAKKILLIGQKKSNSTKMLQESAQKKGHSLTVENPFDFQIEVGEQVSQIFLREAPFDYNFYDVILLRVSGRSTEHGIYLAKHFERVFSYDKIYNKSVSIEICRDKFVTHQYLSQNSIIRQATTLMTDEPDFEFTEKRLGLPFIGKINVGSSQGKGVFIVNDKDEFKEKVREYRYKTLIFQKYIETKDETNTKSSDIRAFVVGGVVVAAYRRLSAGEDFRANYSISKQGEKIELTAEEKNMAIAAAAATACDIAGVDILRKNGIPYLCEVNSNPSLNGITKITGHDVAGDIIDFLVGKTAPTNATLSQNQFVRNNYVAFQIQKFDIQQIERQKRQLFNVEPQKFEPKTKEIPSLDDMCTNLFLYGAKSINKEHFAQKISEHISNID